MNRDRCVYCKQLLQKRSEEHIIQNALGGTYVSSDICCDKCNAHISKCIDAPFVSTFNPIIGSICKLVKTHHKDSKKTYTGWALYKIDGKLYRVYVKQGKITSCPDLSKKYKKELSLKDLVIYAYDFNVNDIKFKQGLSKIAFNYAIDKGINVDILEKGINCVLDGNIIKELTFQYKCIPFFPLNGLDEYLELVLECDLYHNLILFSQDNLLWCYIDLFNTFQFYVLLSSSYSGNPIYESYFQYVEEPDRTIPDIYIRKSKDILTYAMMYGVETTTNIDKLKRDIKQSILKNSVKKDIIHEISNKLDNSNFLKYIYKKTKEKRYEDLKSIRFYLKDDGKLKNEYFRAITTYNGKIVSYPCCINELLKTNTIDLTNYTFLKFEKLSKKITDSTH